MKSAPVSFGSLMCFSLNDNKPKAAVKDMVRMSFLCNKKLSGYNLDKDVVVFEKKVDGMAYNAAANFCNYLDDKYREFLPKGSNRVILTEADFYVNSKKDTEKRCFITAPTPKDENDILRTLSVSNDFYTVKLNL